MSDFDQATMLAAARIVLAAGGGGEGDYLSSKDLEDIFTMFAGVHNLLSSMRSGTEEVHTFIRAEIQELLVLVGDQALTMVEANIDPILHPRALGLLEDLKSL
ncbi:MAG: hypothetical protein GY822_12305 [Deltaproteobacteria bacterium]|nr:hypothetical protein [Deltaproteobacteria bacterium]